MTWALDRPRSRAACEWVESGGPPVSDKRPRGFGTDLIEKIVAHELRNPVDLRFEAERRALHADRAGARAERFEMRARRRAAR